MGTSHCRSCFDPMRAATILRSVWDVEQKPVLVVVSRSTKGIRRALLVCTEIIKRAARRILSTVGRRLRNEDSKPWRRYYKLCLAFSETRTLILRSTGATTTWRQETYIHLCSRNSMFHIHSVLASYSPLQFKDQDTHQESRGETSSQDDPRCICTLSGRVYNDRRREYSPLYSIFRLAIMYHTTTQHV